MPDGGRCAASGPRGAHKQILHSINLHLFARLCCQRHLSREAATTQQKEHGLWAELGAPGFTTPGCMTLGKGISHVSKPGMLMGVPSCRVVRRISNEVGRAGRVPGAHWLRSYGSSWMVETSGSQVCGFSLVRLTVSPTAGGIAFSLLLLPLSPLPAASPPLYPQ